MDIEDRGPVLQAGRFALRVSNIGVLGNPWFDVGRSFDPSLEFPRGSGHELLGHAELWVGARTADGSHRVSGGPIYEWRPTLAPTDRVRTIESGAPGSRWNVDDDGDGRIDEDPVNGIDDDGDGLIDEDFGLPSQEMLTAEYTDDQPEAVSYQYPNGEPHVPLGLSVHQEAMAWSRPGMDDIAGIRFVITNHGAQTLTDLRLGLYTDLDSRERADRGGHLDDRVARIPYSVVLARPDAFLRAAGSPGTWRKTCFETLSGTAVAVFDSRRADLPCAAVVPITHTTDPLQFITNFAFTGAREAHDAARAPARDTSFHAYVFAQDSPPGQGGPPRLDRDRWSALEGSYPTARETEVHDYATLLACGPFAHLDPGQSVEFSVALVVASSPDSVAPAAGRAALLYRGTSYDLRPDSTSILWSQGESGINGHEICFEPPAGIEFDYDPHCPQKFLGDPLLKIDPPSPRTTPPVIAYQVHYAPGHCVWSDLDCDACTGVDGTDLVHHWSLASTLPSSPTVKTRAADGSATVEWDDAPELTLAGGLSGDRGLSFEGYALYRLDDWQRASLLPPPTQWQRIAVYRAHPDASSLPLAAITDSSLAADGTILGRPHHPPGRYRVVDSGLHDGFDVHYTVTSILRVHAPYDTLPGLVAEMESPFVANFDDRVTPYVQARTGKPSAWVVPNPYRARAEWERTSIPGDVFTRHLTFMGLPVGRSEIRIYTLAGDLVATLTHDDPVNGQEPWNLISRNGQDVASGIYLFTIDAASGHQVGRFIVMR